MINSHEELVEEVFNWSKKMQDIGLLKETIYVTDVGNADAQINAANHRAFVFSAVSASFEADYNSTISYGFTIVDKVADSVKSVVNSEKENLFCVSALNDFINYINDGNIDFGSLDFANVNASSGVIVSISGTFTLNIKRTASYWKLLEPYGV